ncbi:right-handed parallel beta-helix repeat-containing protein [Luteolibacter ambystomatis]|uniref:Right-handed parallel beta-helix repeat-containing protein n=1 Tax=Luteolibacter ambystomatis TaxID=2824561 RepID=A0A975PFV1_9BACT|nr:right-handed parallel beta-helix repeat-containing protein [Luteolibacter ambystomatis]QUE51806.1 right-handed parallel beta-helix repeat-containing protein [Luteolibacter ambystomatis]
MTLDAARRILGLEPNDDPATHLKDFNEARDRIAELVRTAPNPTIAARYQAGLSEFDAALNVIRLHMAAPAINPVVPAVEATSTPVEGPGAISSEPAVHAVESAPVEQPEVLPVASPAALVLEPPAFLSQSSPVEAEPVPPPPAPIEAPAEIPVAAAVPEPEIPEATSTAPTQNLPIDLPTPTSKLVPASTEVPAPAAVVPSAPPRKKSGNGFLVTLLILLLLAVAGGYAWLRLEEDKRFARKGEIVELEKKGAKFVEDRLWDEARHIHDQIDSIDPGSEVAATLQRSIEAGINEESQQFIQHWNDRALAEFESGNYDAALAAIKEVLSKDPRNAEALELQKKIEEARKTAAFQKAKEAITAKLTAKDWEGAIAAAKEAQAKGGLEPAAAAEVASLLASAEAGKKEAEAMYLKARDFYAKAKERDAGKYDAQGLELAREAMVLAPQDPEIKALFEKLASYVRTLHVPGDFATPAEALADAHDRDRVVIAEGEWHGPLVVNAAVEIQGAGSDKTYVTCPAADGATLTIGPGGKGARVTGITFRHTSLDPSAERFSGVLVRGGQATFANCHFLEAAGHGLAVIEGGTASASHCRFSSNGWDGASASGAGSSLEVRDSDVTNNIEHGLDVWDGATGTLTGNRCDGNSRNGIHIDAGAAPVTVTNNQFRNNREFGLVLTRGEVGKVSANTATGNLMGGVVVRAAATRIAVAGNRIQSDTSPGLALEKGVNRAAYAGNEITSAVPANPTILENVDFNAQPPAEPAPVPEGAAPASAPTPMPAPVPAPKHPKKK